MAAPVGKDFRHWSIRAVVIIEVDTERIEGIGVIHRLVHVMAAMTVVLAGSAVVAAPASASDAPGTVCTLKENTWLRTAPHGTVLLTLTAGRGFRYHGQGWSDGTDWIYGHGAEYPAIDGWVPLRNTTC